MSSTELAGESTIDDLEDCDGGARFHMSCFCVWSRWTSQRSRYYWGESFSWILIRGVYWPYAWESKDLLWANPVALPADVITSARQILCWKSLEIEILTANKWRGMTLATWRQTHKIRSVHYSVTVKSVLSTQEPTLWYDWNYKTSCLLSTTTLK